MYKVVIIFLLTVWASGKADAQTFLDRLQKPVRNQGTVTVHQDAAIDKLVNGPYTAPATQNSQKPNATKPVTTPEQKKPFVDATKKVYAQFENELGKEIMDIARKVQK